MTAELSPPDLIAERLESALARSPADETAFAWLEYRQQEANSRWRSDPRPTTPVVRSILVRVLEGGRTGTFRTSSSDLPALDHAVRQAMAAARGAEKIPGYPHLPGNDQPLPDCGPLHHPELAEMEGPGARRWLRERIGANASARLTWTESQLAVFGGRHLRRHAAATSASLEVRHAEAPGAGFAAAAGRSLSDLRTEEVVARAAARHVEGSVGDLPALPCPVVLAPEATAELMDLLSRMALTAQAYQGGRSFLREHLGVQVFDRRVALVDDGTDRRGLPFPFDFEGTPKCRVPLIEQGTPKTPALDQLHAGILGLSPTPHACSGDDARAENLFLEPGELSDEELLAAVGDGIWITHFGRLECFDPRRIQLRALARGVRRIRGGQRSEPLPDLRWEASLLQAFGELAGLGEEVVTTAHQAGIGSAITTPAVAVADGVGITPGSR